MKYQRTTTWDAELVTCEYLRAKRAESEESPYCLGVWTMLLEHNNDTEGPLELSRCWAWVESQHTNKKVWLLTNEETTTRFVEEYRTMKLEVGKRYVQRDGTVTGELVESGSPHYPFKCQELDRAWEKDGTWLEGFVSLQDIVAEYKEPMPNQEEQTMNKPHKHAEVIKAWADGAEIEYRDPTLLHPFWVPTLSPCWIPEFEYRVKPELVVRTKRLYTALISDTDDDDLGPDLQITVTKDPSTGAILDLQWKQLR